MKRILILNKRLVFALIASIGGLFLGTNVAHAGATLFLSPSSGTLAAGSTISTTVVVNTGGDPINAVQATTSFPTDLLEMINVSKSGLFTLWPINPTYSNSAGTMNFAGGLQNPGYTGSAGSIVTITFKGKKPGTATVTLGSASVLKNDGSGTDIFTGAGSATFTIYEASIPEPEPQPTPIPEPEEPEIEVLPAPLIFSDTHPEQDEWYISNEPAFYWDDLEGAEGFSYSLDDQKDTTPNDEVDETDNSADFKNIGDGIWYMHVKVLNEGGWSETSHFRIQIDTTPPLEFDIRMEGENPTRLREPKIQFSTTDELSGMDRYELSLNDEAYATLKTGETTPFTFSQLPLGQHTTEVEAFDKAGNKRSSSLDFEIFEYTNEITKEKSGFVVLNQFVLFSRLSLILLIIIFILIVIILLLLFFCCRRKKDKDNEEEIKDKDIWEQAILEKINASQNRQNEK